MIFVLGAIVWPLCVSAIPLEDAIYTNDYCISIYPDYPPVIGDKVTVRLRTFVAALKVTLYSDRDQEIPLTYKSGYWWGSFRIPADYQAGSHFFMVWLKRIKFRPTRMEAAWSKSLVCPAAHRRPLPTQRSCACSARSRSGRGTRARRRSASARGSGNGRGCEAVRSRASGPRCPGLRFRIPSFPSFVSSASSSSNLPAPRSATRGVPRRARCGPCLTSRIPAGLDVHPVHEGVCER